MKLTICNISHLCLHLYLIPEIIEVAYVRIDF